MAGRVLLTIVYLLVRRVLSPAVLVFRKDLAKEADLLVLGHENAVLRRHAGWVRYERADRAWFTALAHLIPRRRWAEVFPMTPATLLAWHRRLAARKYDASKPRKPGRSQQPAVSPVLSYGWRKRTLYRFRTRHTGFELRLVSVGELRHDRGSCLSVCCT